MSSSRIPIPAISALVINMFEGETECCAELGKNRYSHAFKPPNPACCFAGSSLIIRFYHNPLMLITCNDTSALNLCLVVGWRQDICTKQIQIASPFQANGLARVCSSPRHLGEVLQPPEAAGQGLPMHEPWRKKSFRRVVRKGKRRKEKKNLRSRSSGTRTSNSWGRQGLLGTQTVWLFVLAKPLWK